MAENQLIKQGKSDKTKRLASEGKKMLIGYAFIGSVVLGLLIFNVYPILESFRLSFYKTYNGIGKPEGFGIFNYMKMFNPSLDDTFYKSLGITFLYAIITVPLSMVLSFALAVLLNSQVKGIGIFRVCCYLPVIIPASVMGILWRDLSDPRFGLANSILGILGAPRSQFFEAASSSLPTLIFTTLWGLGGGMILWLASLKNVSNEMKEAARIDGANSVVIMFRITIPMCTPIIFYNLILNIIGALQTFANVMTLVGGTGGVDQSLYFYAIKIYQTAFAGGSYEMGYACALAWFLFLIIAALTAVAFKTSKWVYYDE